MTTDEVSHSLVEGWAADQVALRPGASKSALPIALSPHLTLWRLVSNVRFPLYEGFDRRAASRVAVKVFAGLVDAGARASVQREAGMLMNVEHPAWTPVLDLGALSDGTPYVISEFVTGSTLEDLLQAGRMSAGAACDIATQLLGALLALHRVGSVHGDLKPRNVFLTAAPDGRHHARLVDPAVILTNPPQPLAAFSQLVTAESLAYRAPECLEGASRGPLADLYAVGLLLHHMLTGRCLHASLSPSDLLQARLRETFDERSLVREGIGSTLAAFVANALARDPAARFRSAEEMLCELHAARADESCMWRLPDAPRATDEALFEPALASAVAPLPSAPPVRVPEDQDEASLLFSDAPRSSVGRGYLPLFVGMGVTALAAAALLLPTGAILDGQRRDVSVAPVAVEVSPSPAPSPASAPAPAPRAIEPQAPPPPAAAVPPPAAQPATVPELGTPLAPAQAEPKTSAPLARRRAASQVKHTRVRAAPAPAKPNREPPAPRSVQPAELPANPY